jgi:hypothetical protein
MRLSEATRRLNDKYNELPKPPIPPALDGIKTEALKPEEFRARLQLEALDALDIMRYHAQNLSDPKNSITACQDLLDRAGYVPPAKGKAGDLPMGVGDLVPSVEEDVRKLGSAFARMTTQEE